MKNESNKKIARFLYEQSITNEKYPEDLEGESYSIQEMLGKIRALGYPFYYFTDIKLRSIKDPRIMDILLEYYPKMESIYTKGHILKKIDPKRFPVVLELALKEYSELSPLGKKDISSFQEVLSKGEANDEYISMVLSILEKPDNYASSFLIRERLLKISPESLKPLSLFYSQGVLLPATLKEFAVYNDAVAYDLLTQATKMTETDIKRLQNNNSYNLCITMYEYWSACCSVNSIRSEAKKILKKILNNR